MLPIEVMEFHTPLWGSRTTEDTQDLRGSWLMSNASVKSIITVLAELQLN